MDLMEGLMAFCFKGLGFGSGVPFWGFISFWFRWSVLGLRFGAGGPFLEFWCW